jgi:cell division protein FtsQ
VGERTPAAERTRQRFVRRRWARRWLAWRPVLATLALVSVVGLTGWLVLFSSVLDVEQVEVSGARLLGDDRVRGAVGEIGGTPLARLDVGAVEARVEALAPVREAEVVRGWPNAVQVHVEERVAVAVVEMAGRLRGMDADGVLFRDFAAAPDLPRVLMPAGTRSEAMREAARVITALPADLVGRVDHVRVETVDAISLALRGGRSVVWGSAEQSAAKAEVVDALLSAVEAEVYDVSVPGQPTTRD